MAYPGNTIETTHFVIITNDLIQILGQETCEWRYPI